MTKRVKTTTMSVKKSKTLKPYKKRFYIPHKKIAKTLGVLALLGASAYGAKRLYEKRAQPRVIVTGTQTKPQIKIIIPEVPAVRTYKEVVTGIRGVPKGPTPEEILIANKIKKQMDAYYLLQKEFSKSKASLFASQRNVDIKKICSDYNEFLKFYNTGCKYSQEVLNPSKSKGKIGECRKKYMKRDGVDTELVEKLIKFFNC